MTLPQSDDPQAVQPAADPFAEDRMEQSNSDDPQGAADAVAATTESTPPESSQTDPSTFAPVPEEPPLFANVFQPEPPPPPARIPHLGHVALLAVYLALSLFASIVVVGAAVHFRLFNATSLQSAMNDIHYALGSEFLIYLGAFIAAYFTFPLIWHKRFFAGLQWNWATALRHRWALIGTGFFCYLLAIVNIIFVPGPSNTPIEKIFKQPGAAWLLFFFGITIAPFFEELIFRGFLLPSLCTAYDWLAEKFYKVPRRPLRSDGSPQWSFSAMAIASLVTSAPFALMHAEQTGNSVDAVLLLACVSIALCAVRLIMRSLAASVLVHALYNFLIFSMMLVGTQGFQHLDKM
ncbi:MAG: type II CAAX endopeptidase family protein [Terracidiphilus sp.]